ncbi:MAG: phospholipid carrier-dependent glycosyltransferase [Nodosilinea sp.]
MNRKIPLWWGVSGIGALALALRFTGLGHIQTLVFDEVYYVPFALDYLQGTPSFDAHPPLGKYLIAVGIWLGQWPAAWLGWATVEINGTLVSPLAFRWLNALVGAALPVLLAALAWELGATHSSYRGDRLPTTVEDPPKSPFLRATLKQLITPLFNGGRGDLLTLRQHRFALLAGLLMAMEGLTLVESRLALINIYGLALGLLGQWAWLRARQSRHPARWRWVAGIALGAAVNVKWNWAGLWLGLLLWEIGFNRNPDSITSPKTPHPVGANGCSPSEFTAIPPEFNPHCSQMTPMRSGIAHRANTRANTSRANKRLPLRLWPRWVAYLGAIPLAGRANNRLPLRPWPRWVAYLGAVPLATYMLLWLPHLALTGESLGGIHRSLWSTHQSIGVNSSHTYCSPWHSWPLMARPVAYFFERSGQGAEATATTLHAMGNPVLWWLSTAAVLALALGWLGRQIVANPESAKISRRGAACCAPTTSAVVPFILLNYLANWLPWALVSRCTFFYHAMGLATFGTLGLAWLMAQWLEKPRDRPLALLLLGAIALSFLFWLPLYLGLPISPSALQHRWLLPGWI